MLRLLPPCLLVAVLALPGAVALEAHPAAPMDTVLWMHVDGVQDFRLSPVAPPDDFEQTVRMGAFGHSTSCVAGPPAPALLTGSHHTWYGIPGDARYDDGVRLGGRGLAFDLELDPDRTPELVWHMESNVLPGQPSPQPPTVVPEVVLRATLRESSTISVDHEALDTGRLLAQGRTEPALLSPLVDHPQVTYDDAGGRHVYTFRLPMAWATDDGHVPAATGLNLRVDVFVAAPTCDTPDESYLMPDALAVHTSPAHRPSLTVGVLNPLWIEELRPVATPDGVEVTARVGTPWGEHDAPRPVLVADVPFEPLPGTRGFDALAPTAWSWRTNATPDAVRVTARSVQGATADAEAVFHLGATPGADAVVCDGPVARSCVEPLGAVEKKRSPAAPLPALLGVLAAGAVVLRKRRKGL